MSDYNFESIRTAVSEWSKGNLLQELKNNNQMEVVKDDNSVVIIDLTFQYCLAQIVVMEPGFAPYQYVSFEALALDSEKSRRFGQAEMVYFFYDSSEFMIQDVLEELDNGINYCSNYVPDLLLKTYQNKQGFLNCNLREVYKLFHPDDVKKVNETTLRKLYVCTDTFAQYLVVENDSDVLKVLPKIFKLISF